MPEVLGSIFSLQNLPNLITGLSQMGTGIFSAANGQPGMGGIMAALGGMRGFGGPFMHAQQPLIPGAPPVPSLTTLSDMGLTTQPSLTLPDTPASPTSSTYPSDLLG